MKKNRNDICLDDYQTFGRFWRKIFNKSFRKLCREYLLSEDFENEFAPELRESKSDKIWKHK